MSIFTVQVCIDGSVQSSKLGIGFVIQNDIDTLIGADSTPIEINLVSEVEIRDLSEVLI